MKALGRLLPIIIFALVLVLGKSVYTVNEMEQVILTQFGKPVGQPVIEPGLHLKVPFVQIANYFDKRFLEWDGEPNQITTEDKRFIWVDTYARWRITDPLLFFQRLRDERGAQSRLDDILDGETRNSIANHRLIEVVRSSNREFAIDPLAELDVVVERIASGRADLEKEVLEAAASRTSDLGIEILDFRFKRINYEEGVQTEVYHRMVSERQRIAEQYRSEGAGEAARISGDKDRELKRITSEAYREAEEIRGRADAEAADVYAAAYNKDRNLYGFLKSLEVLERTVDSDVTMILGTDGELLKYLKSSK